MVSPTRVNRLPRYRLRHPVDIREGLANALTIVTEVGRRLRVLRHRIH